MKYSDKYEETITINNLGCTKSIRELYALNEKIDESIFYTSSDILDNMGLYLAPRYRANSVISNGALKKQDKKDLKTNVVLTTGGSYFQWGTGTNNDYIYINDMYFLKNINIKDVVFYVETSLYNSSGEISISNANISSIINNPDLYVRANSLFNVTAYLQINGRWTPSNIYLSLCIHNDNDIQYVTSLAHFIFYNAYLQSYYANLTPYENHYDTFVYNFNNISQAYFIAYSDFLTEDVNLPITERGYKELYNNGYNRLLSNYSGSGLVKMITEYKVDYVSKLLASCGCYFSNIKLDNNTITLDNLILNGNIWLGEMTEDGRTSMNWLHTPQKIYTAYNYDINSENEKYDPKKDDDDKDEIAIQTGGVGQQEAKFLKYYLMSSSDLETLSNDMDETIVSNPIQYIISLQEISSIVVPYLSPITNVENIHLGSWVSPNATGLRINSSTGILFAGSTRVDRVFNNFLDYSPYTILNLYVPFCGSVELPTDVAMGKEVSVNITFDMDTFDCCAMIFIDGGYFAQINGNLSKNYSVTQTNFGLHKLQIAGSMASVVGNLGAIAFNPVSALALPSAIGGMINSFGKSFTTLKGGNSDYNDFKTPCYCCLFRSTPRLEDLTGFRKSVGIRCEKYGKLSEFHGFTVCRNPHINVSATEEEKEMLYSLLTTGVILP